MPISTNSILHFTKNRSSLEQILNGHFTFHYCKENYRLNGTEYILGVPMVSFCDIPLSQIYQHIGHYGNYGVGLSKEWAKAKGINPVLYMEDNSLIAPLSQVFHFSQ